MNKIDKQPVVGEVDVVDFKGPVMEMKSEVLDAAMKDLARQIHGSVRYITNSTDKIASRH